MRVGTVRCEHYMRADIPGKGPVEFEGRALPEEAKHFDAVPFYKELSQDVQGWILDLRYAWARQRSAPSALVLRACDELESRIYSDRARVFAHLLKVHPDGNPAEICKEWLFGIITMREFAECRAVCHWTIHPQVGEVTHFLGVAMQIMRTMVATQNAERSPNEQIPMPEILAVIESRPEDEQIAFINAVLDSLTD